MSFENIRRREKQVTYKNNSEIATVTSPGNRLSALGSGEYREVILLGPYGIAWNPPVGSNIQLLKNWNSGDNVAAIGTEVNKEIQPGEIKIFAHGSEIFLKETGEIALESKSKAKIEFNHDGSILINNHFLIHKDGTTERI